MCVVPVPVIKEKIGCTEPNISGALDWGEQEHGYQTNKKLTRKRTQKTVKRHHKKHLCRLVENRPTQKKNSKYNSIVLYTAPTSNTTLAVNIKLWIFFYWEKPFQNYCFYKTQKNLPKFKPTPILATLSHTVFTTSTIRVNNLGSWSTHSCSATKSLHLTSHPQQAFAQKQFVKNLTPSSRNLRSHL